MYVVASFEYSKSIEMAIVDLERLGLTKKQILALPLDKRQESPKMFDSIHQSDGNSLVDKAAVFGTIFMLLGVIYGYKLTWGPIIWGCIGLISGFTFGFTWDLIVVKWKKKKEAQANRTYNSEIILMVRCEKEHLPQVESILWGNFAFGVGRIELDA
jgi:hypothetical protein